MQATEQNVTVEVLNVGRFSVPKLTGADYILDVSFYGTRARIEAFVRNGELRIDELCRDIRNQLEPVIGSMTDEDVGEVLLAIEKEVR